MSHPVAELVVGMTAPVLVWLGLRLRHERAATRAARNEMQHLSAMVDVLNTGLATAPLSAHEVRGEIVADLRNKLMAASLNARVVADALGAPVTTHDPDIDEAVDDLETALGAMRHSLDRLPALHDDPTATLPATSIASAFSQLTAMHRAHGGQDGLVVDGAVPAVLVAVVGGCDALVVVIDALARHAVAVARRRGGSAHVSIGAVDASSCELVVVARRGNTTAHEPPRPVLDLAVIERWIRASGGVLESHPADDTTPRFAVRLRRVDRGN